MSSWNLNDLKAALKSRPELKGWSVHAEKIRRLERYFLSDGGRLALDQDREVESRALTLKVTVALPAADRQGEATKKLNPFHALNPQIDAAVEAARQTDLKSWQFPPAPPTRASEDKLATSDPRLARDFNGAVSHLSSQIEAAFSKSRPAAFNSAELFVSLHEFELHLSNGLCHRSDQSRIYLEAAYSSTGQAGGQEISDEYLNTCWGVSLADVDVEKVFAVSADRSGHMLRTQKPKTGAYPVILHADVLNKVLHAYLTRLYAASEYLKLPSLKAGDTLIPEARGDLLTLTLDPTLPFGAVTTAFGADGLPQKPLRLVDRNRVAAQAIDKRHADYLGRAATTALGNLVVEAGHTPFASLTAHAPTVIEILEFSGLFVDPHTGTFSSEIRLARGHDNVANKTYLIKGGSLSGSVAENFRDARFCDRLERHTSFGYGNESETYYGPACMLLGGVSIVG